MKKSKIALLNLATIIVVALGFAGLVFWNEIGTGLLGESLGKIWGKIFFGVWVFSLGFLSLEFWEKSKEKGGNDTKVPASDQIGMVGYCKTKLMPSGIIVIGEKEITGISELGPMEEGSKVKVVGKSGSYYKVEMV